MATQAFFYIFTPKIVENDSQFDEHIFQMGWFNHQLAKDDIIMKDTVPSFLTNESPLPSKVL